MTHALTTTTQIVRLPQYSVGQVADHIERIRPLVRMNSLALTTVCRQAGLPLDLAEVCGGLLASITDDLIAISALRRQHIERSKRMERVLAACTEPAASALRVAIVCSPIHGKAAVRHWDMICDKHEIGKMAWLLGMPTETAYKYSKKLEKRS